MVNGNNLPEIREFIREHYEVTRASTPILQSTICDHIQQHFDEWFFGQHCPKELAAVIRDELTKMGARVPRNKSRILRDMKQKSGVGYWGVRRSDA